MNLPYGIGDFALLRRGKYFYVDKTHFIPRLEDPQTGRRNLLFLRPRRFGKTVFISTLEHYYDLARKDQFMEFFGGLYIADHPTQERSSYLVLRLDFAGMATGRGTDALRADFLEQLRSRLSRFFIYYRSFVPELAAAWQAAPREHTEPAGLFLAFLDLLSTSPQKLYLLIDEYDNFTNDLIARGDESGYRGVLHASGFVREFYKRIKTGTDGGIIARVFMTGVSPVMVNDMTSGFNIANPISTEEDFHDLCGFHETDVELLLDGVMATRKLSLSRAQVLSDLRRYYDGYLFSSGATRHLYNPNMVLYFMSKLRPPGTYPTELLDMNLRTDNSRLHRLLFASDNTPRQRAIEQVRALIADGSIVAQIHDQFLLEEAYDEKYFASYLYYLGLLTIEREEENLLRLRIPNLVIEQTYGVTLNHVLETATQVRINQDLLSARVADMAFRGEIQPFLDLLYSQVIRKLSNRDLIRMDEKSLKMLLLAYLSLTDVFFPFTEMEVGRGYGDLVLLLNRRYADARYSYLIELKYLKESTDQGPSKAGATRKAGAGRSKKSGTARRTQVEACFTEAEEQLRRYLSDPRLDGVKGPGGWKAVSIVQVGTSALYYRALGQPTSQAAEDPSKT